MNRETQKVFFKRESARFNKKKNIAAKPSPLLVPAHTFHSTVKVIRLILDFVQAHLVKHISHQILELS